VQLGEAAPVAPPVRRTSRQQIDTTGPPSSPIRSFTAGPRDHRFRFSQSRAPQISFVSLSSCAKTVAQARCIRRFHQPAGDTMPDLPSSLWSTGPEAALLASRDRRSGELVFPPLSQDSPLQALHDTVPLDSTGELYSFTVIHPSPKSGEPPHALGFVDFPGPVRIFGRLIGAERPVIGACYQAQSDDRFGYVFAVIGA
jgi:uncharacterized OB-fold protein